MHCTRKIKMLIYTFVLCTRYLSHSLSLRNSQDLIADYVLFEFLFIILQLKDSYLKISNEFLYIFLLLMIVYEVGDANYHGSGIVVFSVRRSQKTLLSRVTIF